ncbi:MAG: hypothetical protein AAF633_09000, partial [Chloroflexota bacterium]
RTGEHACLSQYGPSSNASSYRDGNSGRCKQRSSWKEDWLAAFQHFSPLFKRKIDVEVLVERTRTLSKRSITVLDQFTQLEKADLETIKRFLWESGQECFSCIDFGFEAQPGKSAEAVNKAGFGVFNPDDAFQKSRLMRLLIDEEDQRYPNDYGLLYFHNAWEGDFCVIVMKNGKPVGFGEDGLDAGRFE